MFLKQLGLLIGRRISKAREVDTDHALDQGAWWAARADTLYFTSAVQPLS